MTLSPRCSSSGRLSSSPARNTPCTEGRPGLQSPGAVQTRPEAPGESPPGRAHSAIAALPAAPAGRWPLGRCLALPPLRGETRIVREGTEPLPAEGGWRKDRGLPAAPRDGPKRRHRRRLRAPAPRQRPGRSSLPPPARSRSRRKRARFRFRVSARGAVVGGSARFGSARPSPASARRHHVGPQRPHEAAADPVHGGRRARPQREG